jgi:serpin B
MQKTLDYQGLSLATINSSNKALISSLSNPDTKVTLSIANSAWLRQGSPINSGFLSTVKNDYMAKAESLNFNDPSAPNTINGWVSNATNGKIPTIVNNIPSDEILYLINAVYFKGQWHTVFDPSATQDYPFTTSTGSQVQTPLMLSTSNYNYYENNTVQAIELPYGKNQRLSMDVYLPTDMTSFLKTLSYNQLSSISSKLTRQQGTILLPKFTLSYSQNLNDALKALGMTVAFDPYGAANFNGIAKNVHISDVEHKTYISVDEQGTTAAAATSVGVQDTAVSSGFTMQVDKPFVFTIQDNSTKEILFVGVIQNPNQ